MINFLRNNTQTFLDLLSNIQDGVVIHRADSSILYANHSAGKILELNENELLGKTALNHDWYFIDKEYNRLHFSDYPITKLFATGKDIVHQIIGVHITPAHIKWLDLNATIAYTQTNEMVGLIIFSDITKLKNAYETSELFEKLVNSVDTGITISDPNLNDNPLIYANKTFTQMTGYSYEETIGKNCRYLQNKDRNQEGVEKIKKALNNETSCEVLLKNYTKTGKLFYNLLNISPIFDGKKLKYFVGVQHDVTKQKEQEVLLEEQSLYIQSILDAQEGIVIVTDSFNILYASQALFRFFNIASLDEFTLKYNSLCSLFLNRLLA